MISRQEITHTISAAFAKKLERERELLLQEGDLSRAEVAAEISAAFARFREWLPGEVERKMRELN